MSKASTEFKRLNKSDFGKERIEILYEDEDLMVIYKPSGMLSVSYPGSHSKTAEEAIEQIMRKKGTYSQGHRPFVVHRLDRDTSGVMMFAMNEQAQKKIMDSWHKMVTERLYHAVCENPRDGILPDSGIIDDELAYNSHNVGFVPKKDDKPHEEAGHLLSKRSKGREESIYERNLEIKKGKVEFKTIKARTHFKVIARGKFHTMFELSLDTGRKNQIRAHLASKGYPLCGDENYRAKTDPFGRLALHARTLEFNHPFTGKHMKFEIAEDESWLKCVTENTGKVPAVWALPQKPRKEAEPIQERISHKKMSGMNFIEQGKLKGRRR